MIWLSRNWRRRSVVPDTAPDTGELQVSLGDAYLNLGQDDKALAAFDHAVELSATPLVWNNIAYQLSLKDSHLDRAQQYAESAVSATAAALRNVSLDRLSNENSPWFHRSSPTGTRWAGSTSAKAISTRRKNMSPPPGNSAITAKSATISGRSTRSAARKISPCAPTLYR